MLVASRVVVPALAFCVVFLSFLSVSTAQEECSRTCVARNCTSYAIRYGKYCGVGHTGCAGEQPCDDVDACCKIHDDCTGRKGVVGASCHEQFKKCLKRAQKSRKPGFSQECPYSVVVPTMMGGMDMAILLGDLASKFGLDIEI